MQKEVSRLLENLGGLTDIIESNFSQIKQTLQEFKDDIIRSVNLQKSQEIKAKDLEINRLKVKEGELKGKEEMILNLNRRLDHL